MFIPVTNQR